MKRSILKMDFLWKLKLVSAFCAWVQVNRMAELKRKKASAKGKEETMRKEKREGRSRRWVARQTTPKCTLKLKGRKKMQNHFEVPDQLLHFSCIRKKPALPKPSPTYAFCHESVKSQISDGGKYCTGVWPQQLDSLQQSIQTSANMKDWDRKSEQNMQIKENVLPKTGPGWEWGAAAGLFSLESHDPVFFFFLYQYHRNDLIVQKARFFPQM